MSKKRGLKTLIASAAWLKTEGRVLIAAARDPRTPWQAKAAALGLVAYVASPIDLIPDFIPMIGQLDDLLVIPAGLALVRKLIPEDVWAEHMVRLGGKSFADARKRGWRGRVKRKFGW